MTDRTDSERGDRDVRRDFFDEPDRSAAMERADTANGEGPADVRGGALGETAVPRVLLAVDDSEVSLRAAKVAHQLFGDDAKYFVISVGPYTVMLPGGDAMAWGVPYPMVPLAMPGMATAPLLTAEAYRGVEIPEGGTPTGVDRAEADARSVTAAADLPADAVAIGATGDPVEQIRVAAEDEAIDVIVVGAASGKWWQHFLDPSVSKSVVRHADRPVLIVP